MRGELLVLYSFGPVRFFACFIKVGVSVIVLVRDVRVFVLCPQTVSGRVR